MGRVTINIGTRFRAGGVAAAVLLLAGMTFAVVRAADDKPGHDGHPQAAGPEEGHEEDAASEFAREEVEEEPQALEHVMDSAHIELFPSLKGQKLFGVIPLDKIHIPALFHYRLGGKTYQFPTKFSVLELLAAVLVAVFYIPLGRRLHSGELPAGWGEHAREVLLTFIRDEVAKPTIGHDADRFVPFLWTMFLFILFNNLLGLIPFCGSATGNIFVTAGLALCVFFAIHGSGMAKMGAWHYITSMWPHIDVPFGLGYILKPLIFGLEWLGVLVRNAVLAVRLFANMFAGHVVLATILIFIYTAGHLFRDNPGLHWGLWGTVSVMSVLAQVALSLLELFVAFLQAYIFTFLASIFMGMAMHPAH